MSHGVSAIELIGSGTDCSRGVEGRANTGFPRICLDAAFKPVAHHAARLRFSPYVANLPCPQITRNKTCFYEPQFFD